MKVRLTLPAIIKVLGLWACISFVSFTAVQAESQGPFGFIRCLDIELSREQLQDIKTKLKNLSHQKKIGAESNISISVFFHVIQDSGFQNTATEDQINSQIQVMNAAYAAGGISFTLAGIDTTINDSWAINLQPDSQEQSDMKSSLRVGDVQTLNIYLTQIGRDLLGYATFPWDYNDYPSDDGVVVLYSTLPGGESFPYDLGNTAVHEVGHWLGLFHTFQPSPSATDGCRGSGDFVSDTAAEKVEHYECVRSDSCRRQKGLDPIHNFMDYTPDACLTKFSRGQFKLIKDMWNLYRTP